MKILQGIVYYLTLPLLYLLSILPFPLLYLLSDFLFFVLYRIAGYRRKVVYENLKRSFPQKKENEIRSIEKAFYKYLCDLILESFKTLTISKTAMLKRCRISEPAKQLFDKLHHEKKSCIIVMGHYGNWEWGGNSFSLVCRQPLFVIYRPLKNPFFNALISSMRMRFGAQIIAMKDTFREMLTQKNTVTATAFIADQTPSRDNAYWTTFLNQDTPVFWGTEIISRKLNSALVYVSIKRLKRGRYELNAEMLCENPASTKETEISEMHTRRLEKDILEDPSTWLWSHRRWKHKRPS